MLNTSKQQFFELDTFNYTPEQTTKVSAFVSVRSTSLPLNHNIPIRKLRKKNERKK